VTPVANIDPTLAAAYQRHRQAVYVQCLRIGGGDIGFAEDMTHDVFMKLLEELPGLERHDDLGGWLYRVAANACLDRLRRERSIFGRVMAALRRQEEPLAPSPESLLAEQEEAAAALGALRALPAAERVVLVMKLLEGKSQKEIAAALDLSEGYVSKLVTRAWARVRAAGWEVDHAEA
jgi:RNA polymerase sigma-70 factor, ECF subfamily